MATKKFKCKVCGYIYEGDKAPEKCPVCQAPSSQFEEIVEDIKEAEPTAAKKKGLNTSSNTYTIVYSAIVVVIVAFLMAFVFQALKPKQDINVALDKKKQILSSLNIRDLADDKASQIYDSVIVADEIIDAKGNVTSSGEKKENDGFKLNSQDFKQGKLALYICKINNETKYVIPVYGMGLWGQIWGYVALNEDKNTVYGAFFNHEGETAGLGARIKDVDFQQQFQNKKLTKKGGADIALKVIKKNAPHPDPENDCDGVTGATLTSNGVNNMLQNCLSKYKVFLNDK